jgi:hypothetical protein
VTNAPLSGTQGSFAPLRMTNGLPQDDNASFAQDDDA